jgi:hypothetical protein
MNNQEENQGATPEESGEESQVKNDVQHTQGDESQQLTGGSTGPGDNYDQETKPNTGGSTQVGSYARAVTIWTWSAKKIKESKKPDPHVLLSCKYMRIRLFMLVVKLVTW